MILLYFLYHPVVKMINFLLVFSENQHLMEFSPIMNISFQHIKKEDIFADYYIGVPTYAVIFKYFIWSLTIKRAFPEKNNYPLNFVDSCFKSLLDNLYTPKVSVKAVRKMNVFY